MAKTMKAQVFYEPRKMALEDIPVPAVANDQVLVRVKACGICGSDVAYYFGDSSLETETGKGPLVLGHEFSGDVVEVGEIPTALGLFKPGDRVAVDPVQYCNACEVCKRGQVNLCEKKTVLGVSVNGGFAEYAVSNYTGLHRFPESLTYEQAALTEPLADAVYGVRNMEVKPGDFCVVFGAGVIGSMMVQLAKRSGAATLVLADVVDYRLEIGKAVGADVVVNTKESSSPHHVGDLKKKIEELSGGKFADAVIVATGSVEAMEAALAISGRRSRIVYFGLPSDVAEVRVPALASILWDKTIRFSWLAPLTWPTAIQALAGGLVDVGRLHSHTISLGDLAKGIDQVKARRDKVMKVVVKP